MINFIAYSKGLIQSAENFYFYQNSACINNAIIIFLCMIFTGFDPVNFTVVLFIPYNIGLPLQILRSNLIADSRKQIKHLIISLLGPAELKKVMLQTHK